MSIAEHCAPESSAYERVVNRLERKGAGFLCPAHPDRSPSLTVDQGDGKVLIKCQAGCSTDAVVAALDLKMADLYDTPLRVLDKPREVARYHYPDEDGVRLYDVVRLEPGPEGARKTFRQEPANGKRGAGAMRDVRRVLYRLPDVLRAVAANERVFLVEGEKDADTLVRAGFTATCNVGGAGKWRNEYNEALRGADVVVVADKDLPGRAHATSVAAALSGVAASIVMVEAKSGKDAADHLAAGHGVDDFEVVKLTEVASSGNTNATEEFACTDIGNSRRFAVQNAHRARYVPQLGQWRVYQAGRWVDDDKRQVVEFGKETVRSIDEEAANESDFERRKELRKHATRSESARSVMAMLSLAQSDPRLVASIGEFDRDPWLFNCANGTIDLRSGTLRLHEPADLLSHQSPVVFDPAAECPAWKSFLERVLPDVAMRRFLQQVAGYSLTGLTTEQVIFLLIGPGANGKSTVTTTLLGVTGSYGRQAEPDLLLSRHDAHPTGLADLLGSRAAVCQEIEAGRRLAEVTVKQLTGGDRVKARRMRQDFFEFEPTFKVFLAANHKPTVRGTDNAIWRRMRVIPFQVIIPPAEQDRFLGARLAGEYPGILRWMVDGCRDWQRHGLSTPAGVVDAVSQYRNEMDVLGTFLDDECVEDKVATTLARELFNAYRAWCDQTGERAMSARAFGMALAERGFQNTKSGKQRLAAWQGLRVVRGSERSDQGEERKRSDFRMNGESNLLRTDYAESSSPSSLPLTLTESGNRP